MKFYLLNDKKEPYEVSLEESLKLYQEPEMKIVKQDRLPNDIFISTVFKGFNLDDDDLRLFETMTFDENGFGIERRSYTSYHDALKGHNEELENLKNNDARAI